MKPLQRLIQAAAIALPAACYDPYGIERPRITDLELHRDRGGAVILTAETDIPADACGYAINQRGYIPHSRLQPLGRPNHSHIHSGVVVYSRTPLSLTVTAECARGGVRSSQRSERLYTH